LPAGNSVVIDWDRVGATSTWASEQVFTHPNHPQPYGAFRPTCRWSTCCATSGRRPPGCSLSSAGRERSSGPSRPSRRATWH